MRILHNGSASDLQSDGAGSIPAIRSVEIPVQSGGLWVAQLGEALPYAGRLCAGSNPAPVT